MGPKPRKTKQPSASRPVGSSLHPSSQSSQSSSVPGSSTSSGVSVLGPSSSKSPNTSQKRPRVFSSDFHLLKKKDKEDDNYELMTNMYQFDLTKMKGDIKKFKVEITDTTPAGADPHRHCFALPLLKFPYIALQHDVAVIKHIIFWKGCKLSTFFGTEMKRRAAYDGETTAFTCVQLTRNISFEAKPNDFHENEKRILRNANLSYKQFKVDFENFENLNPITGRAEDVAKLLESVVSVNPTWLEYKKYGNLTFPREPRLSDEHSEVISDCPAIQIKHGFTTKVRMLEEKEDGQKMAVIIIDIEHFPFVNVSSALKLVELLFENYRKVHPEVPDDLVLCLKCGTRFHAYLNAYLKGLCMYNSDQLYVIEKLSDGDANETPMPNVVGKTVVEYYEKEALRTLEHPELPVVFVLLNGIAPTCVPLELLEINFKQPAKWAETNLKERKDFVLPQDLHYSRAPLYKEVIEKHLRLFGNEMSRRIKKFNITLKNELEPIKTPFNLIHDPKFRFGDKSVKIPQNEKERKDFDLAKQVCIRKVEPFQLYVLDIAKRYLLQRFGVLSPAFANRLELIIGDHGIDIGEFIRKEIKEINTYTVCNEMKEIKEAGGEFVVTIHEREGSEEHGVLKVCEVILGLPTMQIPAKTWNSIANNKETTKTTERERIKVFRELHNKMGGLYFDLDFECDELEAKLGKKVQFVGLDTSRCRENRNDSPMIGVSYTIEGRLTDLGGFSRMIPPEGDPIKEFQMIPPKCDPIKEFFNKFSKVLKQFETNKNYLPEKLVIYHSHVKEEEHENILKEFMKFRDSLKRLYSEMEVTLIVVDEMSPVRLFKGLGMNAPIGTCVSKKIISKSGEFFLVSDAYYKVINNEALSRPIKYNILLNESGWTIEEISRITYYLSFGNQVTCHQTIIPNVLKSAQELVKRGELIHHSLKKVKRELRQKQRRLWAEGPLREKDHHFFDVFLNEIPFNRLMEKHEILDRNFWTEHDSYLVEPTFFYQQIPIDC